ncbi:aldehyde dehydrogenase family protein [Haliangium sp.]|uniref:aldehyde dehydrogenase family protein n=1 Tax=Haliangium sp. TaxID=2663208 RepID=UPI003D0C34F9
MKALGDYIDGAFRGPEGAPLVSGNPARSGQVVLETAWSAARMDEACAAAERAAPAWAALSRAQRWAALVAFRDALRARADELADAIVAETGKLRSEAKGEAGALVSRFDLVRTLAERDMIEGPLPGHPHEQLRYHPLGVVGVIGPFNYPLHLCHAYVIPALLMGNAVVVKPSEVTPLAAQRYAEAARDAGLPAGVLNLVHGRAEAGQRLVGHPAVRGVCFTGSYGVGRRIQEQCLDRPEALVALEMGGKNTVIVLDDASVRQAAHEIVVGGYLTTGQRCTATDRVLVHRRLVGSLIDTLRPMVAGLRFGDPEDPNSFAGPLATEDGRARFETALAAARAAGAEAVVEGGRQDGGWFVRASLHRLPDGAHDAPGYTDTELFGPDVHIEVVDDDDEAIAVLAKSPYGFANSIFTASSERFERIYRGTAAGIVNRNRSTNLASPRLPFGGVGRSGNHRPAGAHVLRNMVVPTAVQDSVLGTVAAHPMLAAHLPGPELDSLAARHEAEERAEAERRWRAEPRVLSWRLPSGGRMPTSEAWLARLYAGERVVREKKPAVFDHLRSWGPWFVSVDDDPLAVLDGMSQTATLCGGFAEDTVVRAYVEGGFGDTVLYGADTSAGEHPSALAMATTLRHLVPGLPHVSFANSGAEANEKALALCRLNAANPDARTVLAFEGGFHGRTLLSLHATYNPAKRTPFQIDGYEAVFAPFPVWDNPHHEQPAAPAGFYAAAAAADMAELERRFGQEDEDALLAAEVRSLLAVHQALAGGGCFACIVEPMQCEGGDRYATDRFFRALRLLTRYHQVALIFDEVQTGFGLGGPFAWHTSFQLVDARGRPDVPDAVTFAKRAQVGVVMSGFPDPEPTATQPGSLVRGRLHAEMMSTAHRAGRIEELVRPRLHAVAEAYPHLVSAPRARGYAFAFDLPTPAHMAAYLGQRFWRGAIVYGAGTRTVRYRLSEAYLVREIDMLFETVRRSLSWLDAHPHAPSPAWEDRSAAPGPARAPLGLRVREVDSAEGLALLDTMLAFERDIYEPARRTPPEEIRAAIEDPEGISIVAECRDETEGGGEAAWRFIGFALGTPLEHAAEVEGPDRDPMLGLGNTLYSVSLTVAAGYQGQGVGRALKEAQIRAAGERTRPDGSPRFHYVASRNRVGHTASMTHLNRVFGAHVVCVLTGQYEDPEGQAIYCRIPVGALRPEPALASAQASEDARVATDASSSAGPDGLDGLDAAGGLGRPLAQAPESLRRAEAEGLLFGPAVNKITLMNFATPALVRALEWVSALYPALPHMYLTSSRDECVDKSLRILRWHRKQAAVAIGLDGGYVGHTTAAARSISDPQVHAQGPVHFDWPRVPHPAVAGVDATCAAIRAAVTAAGGSERVFGLMYELVQERTGRVIPAEFWSALDALRAELDLPVIAVETASAGYRNGAGPFASSSLGFVPDIMAWWGGAQTGYLHVSPTYRVPNPLTMVSTWDGDELSIVRQHHELRALRGLDLSGPSQALERALAGLSDKGFGVAGLGLYRVIDAGARADELSRALADQGLRVRRFCNDHLAVIPALDQVEAVAHALAKACEVLS